jgi:hypothetical protein
MIDATLLIAEETPPAGGADATEATVVTLTTEQSVSRSFCFSRKGATRKLWPRAAPLPGMEPCATVRYPRSHLPSPQRSSRVRLWRREASDGVPSSASRR